MRKKIKLIMQKALDVSNLDKSIGELQGILGEDPKDIEALISLGNLYDMKQEYEIALKYYKKAHQIDPANLLVKYDLANYYEYVDKYEYAKKDYLSLLNYITESKLWTDENLSVVLDELECSAESNKDDELKEEVHKVRQIVKDKQN